MELRERCDGEIVSILEDLIALLTSGHPVVMPEHGLVNVDLVPWLVMNRLAHHLDVRGLWRPIVGQDPDEVGIVEDKQSTMNRGRSPTLHGFSPVARGGQVSEGIVDGADHAELPARFEVEKTAGDDLDAR